ncbi:hypothetical protein [Haloplanus aerogenes]|uniref:Uncharacterized protein n=1 Tax=Haloplanus aerogenes TaxID=660522 RepID=A0A3M0D127_9EURY|nr:hypothetical protein [Haloplanus aerogenes]AZH23964.1 hypothetical protein DU502_00605 [Haloplanus aerogenes]RMB13269.1 hypothetical protein ATH50_2602 [Haloplanus aerogenes]
MDWRDLVTIALAGVFGMLGGVFGPVGIVAGIVVGAAIGARWAARSDRLEALERRVAELESAPDDDEM